MTNRDNIGQYKAIQDNTTQYTTRQDKPTYDNPVQEHIRQHKAI